MTTLYEVTKEALEMQEILEANGGELTPELEARLDTLLSGGKDKLNAAACVVRNMESSADECAEEAKRLTQRSAAFKNEASRLKQRMLPAVDALGGSVKTSLFTLYGQNSPTSVSFAVAPDADLNKIAVVHPGLVRTEHELNKTVLKELHKSGQEIPREIAVIETDGNRTLRIR